MRHRVVSSIKKRLHFTMTFVCEQDVWKLIWTLHKFSQWAHFGTRKIYSFGSELRHISDPCCVKCCDAIEEKCVFLFTRFDRCCQSDVRGSLMEVCIALTALLVRFADVVYLSYIDLHHLHFFAVFTLSSDNTNSRVGSYILAGTLSQVMPHRATWLRHRRDDSLVPVEISYNWREWNKICWRQSNYKSIIITVISWSISLWHMFFLYWTTHYILSARFSPEPWHSVRHLPSSLEMDAGLWG